MRKKTNSWYRRYHGTCNDPKFRLIAKRSNAHLCYVLAYWDFILEHASAQDDRGCLASFDTELAEISLDLSEKEAKTIFQNFCKMKLICDKRVAAWDKRQFASDTSAERVRRHRENKKNQQKTPEISENDQNVTLHRSYCDVTVTHQSRTEKNREEQSKEKEKKDLVKFNKLNSPKLFLPKSEKNKKNKIDNKKITNQTKISNIDDLKLEHIQDWLKEERTKGNFTKINEKEVFDYFVLYSKGKENENENNDCNSKSSIDYVNRLQKSFYWDKWQPKNKDKEHDRTRELYKAFERKYGAPHPESNN